MEKIKIKNKLNTPRATRDDIVKKILEFRKEKRENSPEEYQKIISRFKNARDGVGRDAIIAKRIYSGWTKEDFDMVLAGIDSDEEFEEVGPKNIQEAWDVAGKKINILRRITKKLAEAVDRIKG